MKKLSLIIVLGFFLNQNCKNLSSYESSDIIVYDESINAF